MNLFWAVLTPGRACRINIRSSTLEFLEKKKLKTVAKPLSLTLIEQQIVAFLLKVHGLPAE